MFKARGDSRMKAAEMLVANFDLNSLRNFDYMNQVLLKWKRDEEKINFFTFIT